MAIPEMRLKGFEGDLMKCHFSSVAKPYFVPNKFVHHQNLLSLSYGKIKRKDIKSTKGLLPASFDTYQIVKNGIIVFRFTDLQNDKKSLRVGLATEEGIISPAYVCVECKDVLPEYLYLQLYSYDLRKVFYSMGDGLRQTLSYNDVKDMPIYLPSPEEQEQIVSFFGQLESIITKEEQRLLKMKQMKAACLLSMFPQPGKTTPKVRFKGFTDAWVKKSLNECLDISTDKNVDNIYGINNVLSVSEDYGVVNQIKLLGRSYAGKSVSNYGILNTGEIVYTKSPLSSKPYGIVKMNSGDTGIVSVLYAIYRAKDNVSAEYIHYYFDPAWRLNHYLRPLVNKGAKNTMNISDEMALNGSIIMPNSLEEQEQIASFFRNLDAQIRLHEQKLAKLQQIKTSCLDKMFV